MKYNSAKIWGGITVVVAFIVSFYYIYAYLMHNTQQSLEYRFSFPEDKKLTEADAIEITRQALILDGKQTDTMHPVGSGHYTDGHERIFCTESEDTEKGWVLWWLERPDCVWEYSVGIRRDDDAVVCTISKPK